MPTTDPVTLVLAPHGRDAEVASQLLAEANIRSHICGDLDALTVMIDDGAGFAVVTEGALRHADLRALAQRIESQPPWSDFQFIVLTCRGGGPERDPVAAGLGQLLRNVSFLERPFHPTSLISMARTAAHARRRQFEARVRIDELNASEVRLRTALLAGKLGTWELQLDDRQLTVSAECKAVYGYAAHEPFDYDDLVASIHPDDTDMVHAMAAAAGDEIGLEYRIVQRDGAVRWVAINGRLVRDRDGRRPRMVGVAADVTDRKASEAALRSQAETLEARVAERTAELEQAHRIVLAEIEQREEAEARLRQAQKMETIGQLTGGIAHDFNNLLMAVIANLELLQKQLPPDARTLRLLDGAMRGAQRGASLTQRLLAFARKQELDLESRTMIDLIRGMTELLERSIGPTIELTLDLPAEVPPVLIDPNQFELAVLNLAVNARDAMPDGGRLTLAVDVATASPGATSNGAAGDEPDLPPGEYVRLTVSDTGQGMSEETLKKATEPFFSTKGVGNGTGLGLSMIHGLAVQLNGVLRLLSKPGEGTRAELWLPVADAAVQAPVPAPVAVPDSAIAEPRRVRILAVDDDMLIAMSTVDMLEDLGHEVIEANSGEEALQVLRDGAEIDLMLTDFAMPRMNGAQLAEAARELRPGLPILVATGYAELPSGSSLNLPRLGKPYQQAQLDAEIQKLLRH